MAEAARKKNERKNSQTAEKTVKKTAQKKSTAKTGKKTGAKTSQKNRTKKETGAHKKAGAREKKQAYYAEKETQVKEEVLLWGVLAVCILAFLSNFGLVGRVGEIISTVLFGVFGLLAYLIPFFLFFFFAFLISNRKNKMIWIKIAAVLFLIVVICGFLELMGNGYVNHKTIEDYYDISAAQKSGGGVIGGTVSFLCCPSIGVAGTYVILFILGMIAVVLLTEKSMFAGIKKGSRKVYYSAKEESVHQREIWENRKIQHQMKKEERRAQMDAYLREEEKPYGMKFHNVANIVLEDYQSAAENKYDQEIEEDWLEEEAWKQREKKTEKTKKEEAYIREQDDVEEEEQPKNFWERLEEQEIEPLDVEVEEVNLMNEDREEKGREQIDEIFIPQCRMMQMEHEEEGETKETFEEQREVESEEYKEERHSRYAKEQAEKDSLQTEIGSGFSVQNKETLYEKPQQRKSNLKAEKREERNSIEKREEQKREYEFPPLTLLNFPKTDKKSENMQELKETAIKLQQTLHSFGVNVNVIDASCGPAVTRYELQPEQGVKVSRIVNLADDIKLNLAAADIRIEAPIPGKAAVGIEVPNKENSTVFLRELLESKEFQKHPSNLAFAAGKDIGGNVVVTDIAKMPHLLIAGATGSGKSVCINTIIMSLLYKANPEDVKLIMIDPKVVELSVYNGIPHLMIPVVTDPKKAAGALNWAVAEMTERYNKFAVMGVRDLKGYNQKAASVEAIEEENKPEKMPQIVIIVDELADLMMVAQNDVEESICRLAQLARAAGIHLIIATQRPSVNVITGVIKANMPSRIAFAVSSGVDSRTILDMNGAEKLLGKGDMLFFPQGLPKPARVQGAFVSDAEVSSVVEFLKAQNLPCYTKAVEEKINLTQNGSGTAENNSQWDPYFEEAGRIVIEKEKASIGMLQRGLKVGFNRAARIMEQLCEAGVVGEEEGTKPRKVLMSIEEFETYIEEYIG